MKCENPIWIEVHPVTKEHVGSYVPCSRCYSCIQTKRSVWTFRLLMELRVAESAYFVTLTYDPQSVPYITEQGIIYENLDKSHVQQFTKALRQKIYRDNVTVKENRERWLKEGVTGKWSPKYRYFTVGEYGGQGDRPHYHIVMYNIPNDYIDTNNLTGKLFSETLEKIWNKGIIDIDEVARGSAHYMTKHHLFPYTEIWLEDTDRQKPFAIMSKKPGLGLNWIDDKITNYIKNSKNSYATLKDGSKIPIGRYLKEKVRENLNQEEIFNIKEQSQKYIAQQEKTEWEFFVREAQGDIWEAHKNLGIAQAEFTRANRKKAIRQLKRNNKL